MKRRVRRVNNGAWTLKREREIQGATLLDHSDRFYAIVEGERRYGYRTQFSGLFVCYTCGHLCECGEEGEE
jgi:transcription initiation factor IIE alpha subunit